MNATVITSARTTILEQSKIINSVIIALKKFEGMNGVMTPISALQDVRRTIESEAKKLTN